MAKVVVIAGDFLQEEGEYLHGAFTLKTSRNRSPGVKVPISSFKSLEVATEESSKNISRAIGMGLAGALILGPVGAIAGYLLAGEKTEVTFMATLKGGRELLAATDSGTFKDISERFHH